MSSQENIVWHQHTVTRQWREQRNGHKGAVLWFTGLSGSGKSTLAGAVEAQLAALGMQTYLLDGDNIRHGLCGDLGFNEPDRQENIRRIGEVAKLMVDAGLIVATAFISPYQEDRQRVRALFEPDQFYELYVDTPIEICEERDPKGLYRQARAGKIAHFTGIDAPYQPPENPELHLDGTRSIDDSLMQIIQLLQQKKTISIAN
ncbi:MULTISPECIES: adenylyl-sulfate kinase [Providencia]|uniref:Adenylyl-sulfate kinase n=2 Tax=Providencia alcalifaciens TaxID=126385 RepID=B6XG69_9GAMM|nr:MULTISPECIES: adenylyl-sulfate kinase [Providencia]EKT67514.1 adenylylsulfate kinase [Providencia alcalifaciens Dmel2]ATG16408.1 adenylyl-sulfate kinase [Providencia alcalifaciens]EEB45629.1 adenylyl-sulfate kinase [Providencia alcalifaciens DSM 30120]EUD03039.1 adenylyl-sulfate kinase [Providencia alcalifaciens RIMD 1656011]EUD11421.1 adenylyl-sulfate kinase [Providencia alcalifaciens 205/92]